MSNTQTQVIYGSLVRLKPDNKNANKGSEFGEALLEKSLSRLGAGRSILVDRKGNVIAGNKTLQGAINVGIEDCIIVESDGSKLVVVQRTDLDIDSKQGRELALADNKVAELNLKWDTPVIDELATDFGIDLTEWGFDVPKGAPVEKPNTNTIRLIYNDTDYERVTSKLLALAETMEEAILKLINV